MHRPRFKSFLRNELKSCTKFSSHWKQNESFFSRRHMDQCNTGIFSFSLHYSQDLNFTMISLILLYQIFLDSFWHENSTNSLWIKFHESSYVQELSATWISKEMIFIPYMNYFLSSLMQKWWPKLYYFFLIWKLTNQNH